MGSCVNKPKKKNEVQADPLSFRRKFSSILMTEEESQKIFPLSKTYSMRLQNADPASMMFLKEKILLSSQLSETKEYGFQEKKMSISSDTFTPDHLSEIGISVICKKGLKIDTPNQDDYIVIIDPHCLIFGVFDGHGPHGHTIAHMIQSSLPKLLLGDQALHTDPEAALRRAFNACSEEILQKDRNEVDCSISGSTATILCIFNQRAYVAHVGDSRAVLLQKSEGKIISQALTKDHRPDLPEEAKRIEDCGGEVRRIADGPCRVFKKGMNYPGINMSRSIGDFVSREIGITSEPDIMSWDIEDNFEAFVICSDGVWEFVSGQEVADISAKCAGEPKKVAERLATFAWMQWKERISDHVDDITVVVFYPNSNARELFYFL